MEVSQGTRLLKIVQQQRLDGTIDKPAPGPAIHKEKALAWLRKSHAVDEERAILIRLDREEKAAHDQRSEQKENSVYGSPVIDQIRERNLARQAQEEKRKEEKAEREARELPVSSTKALTKEPPKIALWAERYRREAEASGLKSVPKISFIERAGPSTLLGVAVVLLCVMFAQNYSPPSRAGRLFPDIPVAAATIGALIAMNIVVHMAWRIPPFYRLMNKYFLLVIGAPRALSLVGNIFSHQIIPHLAANMAALWFIGTKLHEDIGRGPFLAVYLGCGVAASNIFLVQAVLRKLWTICTTGCSGSLCGILAAWLCINSDKGLRIWPLPVAATEALQPIYVLAVFIAVEIWGLRRGFKLLKLGYNDPRIDHVSHLAGYGAGIVAAQYIEPRSRRSRSRGGGKVAADPVMLRVESTAST
ncbi:MAG: hypothetical protein Q9222_003286 [Ikaeria aurantiellina]